MKKFHAVFGLVIVIVFLLTGQYMDKYLQHLHGMLDGPRLLYRTRHIFILLAGLLHIAIGTYFTFQSTQTRRIVQLLGSVLIVVATVLFVVAFFYEPKLADLKTPFSHWGMYTIFAGTFLHLLSSLSEKFKEPES